MPAIVRRTSTKVVDGQVTRKSRGYLSSAAEYIIRKEPAHVGFTHVVSPNQLRKFLQIVPGWPEAAHRLHEIVLTGGSNYGFGYQTFYQHSKVGVIALCAWPKELWKPVSSAFYSEHRHVLDALGVERSRDRLPHILRFTVAQARAFSLLHVFMHELGHHRDWLRRRGRGLPNKELIAEDYANRYFDQLLPIYCEKFGDPRGSVKEDEMPALPPVFKRVI
jgi:hypothetical protein